jgi:hypothetical protein
MKKLKSTQMENLLGGAPYTNKMDQEAPDPQNGGFLTSCAGASVGLALGFAGLVAGGASVVGAGIGAAAFIYASAQWGASCR